MNKIITLCAVLILGLSLSCSKYNVKTELAKNKILKGLKRSGIMYRFSHGSMINRNDMYANLEYSLASYVKINDFVIIKDADDKLWSMESDMDRFYQLSNQNKFLYYKSIGVITMYLRNNTDTLKKIIQDNGLDSLVIYEIDGGFSPIMQFIDFNSSVVILDADLQVCYLDYQKVSFDIDEWDPDLIKKHLMDKLNDRLNQIFFDYKYLQLPR